MRSFPAVADLHGFSQLVILEHESLLQFCGPLLSECLEHLVLRAC